MTKLILNNNIESTYIDYNKIDIVKQDRVFLEKIAKRIVDSGLITPAVFFLETMKPLSLLGSHALVFLGPLLNSFIQSENYYRKVEVFEKPENIELLLKIIEEIDKNER